MRTNWVSANIRYEVAPVTPPEGGRRAPTLRHWALALALLAIAAGISLSRVAGAAAEGPSDEVPDTLKSAIRSEIEGRGHDYAGLCRDIPDGSSNTGKYCAVVLDVGTESAEVAFAPRGSGDFKVVTFAFRRGTWAPDAGRTGDEPTPGPSPAREWSVEDVEVVGSTVTVRLRVFAGIDVGVMLYGKAPDETIFSPPMLTFAFRGVPAGQHELVVKDVVGFEAALKFTVQSGQNPGDAATADGLPVGLEAAIRAEIERGGHAYAGLCRDLPDDGSAVGKHCANVISVGEQTAEIAYGPLATGRLAVITFTLSDGAWVDGKGAPNGAPGVSDTGTGSSGNAATIAGEDTPSDLRGTTAEPGENRGVDLQVVAFALVGVALSLGATASIAARLRRRADVRRVAA